MFSKVRELLKNHSPDWLNTEVNKDLLQNLTANIKSSQPPTPQTTHESEHINVLPSSSLSSQERVRERSKEININNAPRLRSSIRRGSGSLRDRQFSTTDSSLFPTPGTPHWRRIGQVFQALDTAPEPATYNELIGYVRETTGKGCSRKLISKWKKQRISHQSSDISHQLGSTTNKQEISGLEAATNIISSPRAIAYNQISQSSIISATPSTVSSLHLAKSSNKSTSKKSLMTDDWSLMTVLTAGITIALVGWELIPLNSNRLTENIAIASVTAPITPLTPIPERRKNRLEPRNIKIELTLSNPQDLKVKPGDKISAGQVLSDRANERNRLQAKKKQLQLSLEKLNLPLTPIPQPKPIPEIAELPPVSYAEAEAAIKLKQQQLTEANRAIALQQEKIEQLRSLFSTKAEEKRSGGAREKISSNSPLHPCTPAPLHKNCSPVQGGASKNKLILEHERANLKNLEAARESAQIQLEVAQSKLTTAKEQRAYLEYQRQLEQTRRAIAVEQQHQAIQRQESERQVLLAEREYSKAQIETQIQTLDYQIHQLSTVTAPYEGTIKKVKWTGQSDHNLTAVVTLSVNSRQSSVISNNSSVNGDTRTVKTE